MTYLIRTNYEKRENRSTKYMGAFLPLCISSSISIYCLANGVTKSKVIEDAFNDWLTKNYTKEMEQDCILRLANNLHERYKELQLTERSLPYSIFCDDIKKELSIKGLYYSNIQIVIKAMDAIHFKK